MKKSISKNKKAAIFKNLKTANLAFQKIYPGDSPERQPVHTVYGGANLFKYNTAESLGRIALNSLKTYAPNFVVFARAFNLPGSGDLPKAKKEIKKLIKKWEKASPKKRKKLPGKLAREVYAKVTNKLQAEAVEDFRIDFEDGFGNRSDEEEDATAERAALEVAKGMKLKTLPPYIGIRIKPFTEEMKERGLRTLDIFLSTLLNATKGKMPDNFVVMLPKVTITEQVSALVKFFEIIEKENKLKPGALKMEMMVETTQAIMAPDGTNPLRRFVLAGKGRLIACHFGTYDYTASCNITAKYQTMDHPVCDFAHHMTKVALAHTGIWLSDGATNIMPVGPHRGKDLNKKQKKENRQVVHRAWKQGYDHVRHSLWNGFYQGWDLNPAQLPMRYAAVFAFFLESMDDATLRLKTFVEKAARASLIGDVFDDAATGQGLLNYFLRALNSGAITEEDILATGLTLDEIRGRSFLKILENRKK
ncbi:MAG TPA: phosphoenolpyruvate kinase [Bacteroidetes bacterium]|nr:phosphoenolpyruvate kinase [Bacteroidota bacterium]